MWQVTKLKISEPTIFLGFEIHLLLHDLSNIVLHFLGNP